MLNNNEEINKGNMLYKEKLSEYIAFGESYKSQDQILGKIWAFRIGAILFIILIIFISYYLDYFHWILTICLIICALYFFLLSVSEAKVLSSATPIVINDDGIRMFSPSFQRLLGRNGFVLKDDIESIIIRRHHFIIESVPDGKSWKAIRWDDAPAEFIINTKKGAKYRSGKKHPQKVSIIIDILRTKWDVPILEKDGKKVTILDYENGYEVRL